MSVEIKNISKTFNKKTVLNNLTLTADTSEILGLIGPSGAGKTTLIRIIIGALNSDSGEVAIKNIKVPNKEQFKNIGFMPQADALYQDLSGLDNLKFFGRLYGLKGKKLKERCEEMLEFIGLSEDKNKLVINYSGGMKKRLSLVVALLHDPEYLILDEPTVGIDPLLRKKIWDEFNHLAGKGKTLIISTHVMDEAIKCTKCALINNGKLLAFDSVKNLLSSTKNGDLEELFLFCSEGEN